MKIVPTLLLMATAAMTGLPVTAARAPSASHAAVEEYFEVPIVDETAAVGTLQVRTALGFASFDEAGRAEARRVAVREAQMIALMEFARLRAAPNRPVDARRLSDVVSGALTRAGIGHAEVYVLSVRADAA